MRILIKNLLFLVSALSMCDGFSQDIDDNNGIPVEKIDSLYREDQFYIGATYNIVIGKPSQMTQRGLSGGIHFGYLRDMPINKRRNVAVAIGAGMSFNRYGQTLFVGETQSEETIFRVIDPDLDIDFNRFSTAAIEVPIEFRWRTSTPTRYKFWRIYGGVRLGYVYWYRSYFSLNGNAISQTDIPEFDPFRISATLSFGNSNVNFFGLYTINPFFSNATTQKGQSFDLRSIHLGLIFYIL